MSEPNRGKESGRIMNRSSLRTFTRKAVRGELVPNRRQEFSSKAE